MLPQKHRSGNLDPSRATGLMSITAPVHTQSPPATMMLSPYNRRVFRKARFSVIVNTKKSGKARKGPQQGRLSVTMVYGVASRNV